MKGWGMGDSGREEKGGERIMRMDRERGGNTGNGRREEINLDK